MTTLYLVRPEGRIAYDDSGSGPLVIAAPSLGDVRQEYRFLVPQLVDAGYRVVTMDLRGMGESSVGWSDYSAPAIGSDILALVESLSAGPALLIGTSIAAAAAVWVAVERPDLVAGTVMIGPAVRDIPTPAVRRLAYKGLLQRLWGPTAWRIYYRSLYPESAPADMTDYIHRLTGNLREPGRFAVLQAMVWASKADVERRLDEVQAPVLVVMGSKDPDFKDPAAEARLVADRLHCEAIMIESAGHYPHAEMPAETGPHILRFFNSVQPTEALANVS
jgi:pimeloyl-ACP methyl ester carboxylesterase